MIGEMWAPNKKRRPGKNTRYKEQYEREMSVHGNETECEREQERERMNSRK